MKVLITGGTGSLGRQLVRAAADAGHSIRVVSRRPPSQLSLSNVEWAQVDMAAGAGLRAALDQVDAVLHAASDVRRAEAVDVGGMRHLVESSRATGIAHIVYVSIVGVDVIPYKYYRLKFEAEKILETSGVPHTILRATQFHSLVDALLARVGRLPLVLPLPTDLQFQSVDESEVAGRLVRCVDDGPRGRADDFGGPEVLTLGAMAAAWCEVKGLKKKIIHVPVPGAIAAAFRAGKNTAPAKMRGTISWGTWLAERTRRQAA